MNNIYLDNAAKTIPYKECLDKYVEISSTLFANPSSIHGLGRKAERELDLSREELLRLLKMNDHQVIYLSSATEANNLALKGVALRYKNRGKHIITSAYEHPSVLEALRQLEKEFGFEITCLLPDSDGLITTNAVKSAIRDNTILVSIMAVNNEIGAINPISDIAKLLKSYPKIFFHVDAAQELGKSPKLNNYQDVDLLTISSHKIHGLIGVGALIKRKSIDLLPLLSGGGQEYNFRSGTNDVALALSFLVAVKKSLNDAKKHYQTVSILADILLEYLNKNPDLYELNLPSQINPYIINFSTKTKKSSVVVEALSNAGIMVSSTSACHSSKEKGSYVVKALGKDDNTAHNTVRISLSYLNTKEDIEALINNLDRIIGEIR